MSITVGLREVLERKSAKRFVATRPRPARRTPEVFGIERKAFTGNVEALEAIENTMELKVRRVRTPAGVARFKQPIGSIIVRDSVLNNIRLLKPVFDGWDLVEDRKGKKYDVGRDEDGKWRAYGHNDWDDLVAEADSEDGIFKALDERLAGGTTGKVGKKPTRARRPQRGATYRREHAKDPRSPKSSEWPESGKVTAGSGIYAEGPIKIGRKPVGRVFTSEEAWWIDLDGSVSGPYKTGDNAHRAARRKIDDVRNGSKPSGGGKGSDGVPRPKRKTRLTAEQQRNYDQVEKNLYSRVINNRREQQIGWVAAQRERIEKAERQIDRLEKQNPPLPADAVARLRAIAAERHEAVNKVEERNKQRQR